MDFTGPQCRGRKGKKCVHHTYVIETYWKMSFKKNGRSTELQKVKVCCVGCSLETDQNYEIEWEQQPFEVLTGKFTAVDLPIAIRWS